MGTRSTIARQNEDGSFDSIYCHWDGYPDHHGPILYGHYTDPAKVDALLALGSISSLGEEIGEKHNFDKSPNGQCNAYHRDRGEDFVPPEHHADADLFAQMLAESWTEWVYIFRPDGKWYYTNNPSPTWFKLCGAQMAETELTPKAWEAENEEPEVTPMAAG